MNAVWTAWSNPQQLTRMMSLTQLQWVAIVMPLLFVVIHHVLMIGPMHPFFHNWFGFGLLLLPLAAAVWAFTRGIFGAFRGLQAEVEELHEQTQVLLVEQERHHIAREMHDGLAQILSFVNTKAQAVEQFLDRGDYEAARGHNAELAAAARKVYSDIREGIVALRVEVGGERSLRDIFDEYVAEFSEFARLPVEIVWEIEEEELELAPVVEVQVLRIVQEALTNVRRHAGARQARVTFASNHGTLEISISDDGQGFDPSSIARGEWPQFGLRSMHERAEAAGGTLEVESELGGGTTIRAKFPGVVRYATMAG